jgi:phosphomethylpyrimidine synthase
MKITQEVRDFAAKQNASADTFLEATQSSPAFAGEGDRAQHGEGGEERSLSGGQGSTATGEAEAEAGMAEMSEKFREKGSEIYLPAVE